MGRCANMERDLPLLPTPARALPDCCGSKLRRLPYEADADLALPAGNGPLQALALPAPCGDVGFVQPDGAVGGADSSRLLRYTHRRGTHARGHYGPDRAVSGDRRVPCGHVAHCWLC